MRNIFIISDTHFSHTNILKFTDEDGKLIRPGFENTDHMDEVMIDNWNKTVSPQDIVYHGGDVGFNQKRLEMILPRLNGAKRLIVGNHDSFKMSFYEKYFQKIMSWRFFNDEVKRPMLLCHYPLHTSNLSFKARHGKNCLMLHGHIHQNIVRLSGSQVPDPIYVNVCVEHTNYTPVALEELAKR